jgi:hypothetical protein
MTVKLKQRRSRTLEGAVIAALSETVRSVALIVGLADTTTHGLLAIVTAWGLVWSIYGLRKAVGK